MQRCAYLCSEVNGEGNDPEVDGPKRQEARVQEEGHGLLLSPRQAMIGERAGVGVVKQKPVSKWPYCLIPLHYTIGEAPRIPESASHKLGPLTFMPVASSNACFPSCSLALPHCTASTPCSS
ncbi:unnamed protein product [Boreogadus saida]